jgi:hypothetical protein
MSRTIPISIPEDHAPTAEPQNVFYGVSFSIDQIVILINGLVEKGRDLKGSLDQHEPVRMKIAASDIATLAGQAASLSRHLAHIMTVHINRSARI